MLSPEERETLAYHAMGRALVAMLLPGPDPISGISLMPLDSSRLTGTLPDPVEHQVAMCREELQARLAVLLAGRAAERLVFNRVSTAGTDALQRALNLARAMVTHHGMAEELLPVPLDHEPAAAEAAKEWPPGRYGEAMTEVIGRLVRERIKQALDQASYILKKRRQVLDTGARLLLEKETLTAETLRALAEEQTPAAA